MISDGVLGIQYYGEFCQFINFKRTKNIRTCGVTVDTHGMRYLFNPDFCDSLDQEEMNYIMLHEIFHLLWNHQSRTRRLGYEHKLSNVVQDMIINNIIDTDIVGKMQYRNKTENRKLYFAKTPVNKKTNKIKVLHLPEEYKGELYFETMYEWISDEKEKYDNWKSECKCDKDLKCKCNRLHGKESCECSDCPVSDYLREIFDDLDMDILDFLDCHLPCDLPEEYRKIIIENVKNILKNRGDLLSPEVQVVLDKLTRSKKDYLKDIKIGINGLFGSFKNKSITKRNRRSIQGVKGKRKESFALNVMLDVSGSMNSYFEKALSYVCQNDISLNVIQCDTKVTSYTKIKNMRQLRKLGISGLGGTTLQPGIDYISSNKELNKLNTLILTDGECEDFLNTSKLKKTLVLSLIEHVKTSKNAKCIVINEK